jgi:hypothetical protein
MDITDTLAPKSDQLNADDLIHPRTATVVEVRKGTPEQPVEIVLDAYGPGRPFKPSKTVRRVLAAAWGTNADVYAGRSMTLYNDPTVRFGGVATGGIRVSHLSHIDKSLTLALTTTRGKRAPVTIQPLPTASKPDLQLHLDALTHADSIDALRAAWAAAGPAVHAMPEYTALLNQRRTELTPAQEVQQ